VKAIILAAGEGARLFPFTATRPKPMIPVGGQFVLERLVLMLKEAGVADLLIVVGHQQSILTDYFKRGTAFGVNMRYIVQEQPVGIGDAILQAREHILAGEYFLLVYADIVTSENIFRQTLQSFSAMRAAVATVCLTSSTQQYGNIFMDQEMRIRKIIEKPVQPGMGNYVLAGVFVLPSRIFDLLDQAEGNMERAWDLLIEKEGLIASIWEEGWIDLGCPWDILSANRMVMDTWQSASIARTVEMRGNVSIEGPVRVADSVVIESGTVMKGPSYVGPHSFLGNNVLVRPYTAIGAGSTTGFGVELKNCILFDGAQVGRLSFVGDSVLGEGVDIGSGMMTINRNVDRGPVVALVEGREVATELEKLGSFIGDGSRIGAGNCLSAGLGLGPKTVIPHHRTFP